MCNICVNSLVFSSKDLDALKELHQQIKNITETESGNSVANLMRAYSYTEHDIALLCDRRDYFSFVDTAIEQKDSVFFFNAETCSAWSENLDCLFTLLKERYNNKIRLYASSEEEGMGIYTIADSTGIFFKDKFKVDACVSGEYFTEYFTHYAHVIKFLQAKFPTLAFSVFDAPEDVEEAINDTLDLDTEDFFHIHIFEPYSSDAGRLGNYYYSKEAA